MLDLGASINVMPYSIFTSLRLGALQKTDTINQLANTSFAHPRGIVEDVLVQVKNLFFLVDFYVLNIAHGPLTNFVPIILGRPFMKAIRTKIDVDVTTLTMEFDGDIVHFDVLDAENSFTLDYSLCAILTPVTVT